jgi:hypothetical protein
MGEPSDPRREMAACRRASIEPATKQANRGSGTGAVGGSHGDRRADPESAACRHAASADRASGPAAACLLFGGGFCVCETHCGGGYGASERHGYRRRLPAARKPRVDAAVCGGGKERRIGEYKARHVETEPVGESTHVALCISPRRGGAGWRGRNRRYHERKPMRPHRSRRKATQRSL